MPHVGYLQVQSDVLDTCQLEVRVVYKLSVGTPLERDRLVLLAHWQGNTVSRAISDDEQREHLSSILSGLLHTG